MPDEHLLLIPTAGRNILVSWEAREQLLARMRLHEWANELRITFLDAGPTQPPHLKDDQEIVLLCVIDEWARDIGRDNLPQGIWNLRLALDDEVGENPDPRD